MKKIKIELKLSNLIMALLLFQIGLIAFLGMVHLLNSDVLFHSDIARDFLVLREIVTTHKPTLIGPRSGGITGIFHGPLWYYISLIPFIMTKGNPLLMGWFWWGLGVLTIFFYIKVALKLTGNKILALSAGVLFSGIVFSNTDGIYNPYGAIAMSGILFYFISRFFQSNSYVHAAAMWLCLGLMTHFQMAFTLPLGLLLIPVFIWQIFKTRRCPLGSSFLFFLLPLSTFFLFDVRHDWLQFRSLGAYLTQPGPVNYSFINILYERLSGGFMAAVNIFSINSMVNLVIVSLFIYFGLRFNNEDKKTIKLFLYLYLGWWILTLFFSGTIQGYYYSAFVPMTVLVVALIAKHSKITRVSFVLLACMNAIIMIQLIKFYPAKFNSSSWKLLSRIANDAFEEGDLGYFIYSQDQFGYPLKYSFLYNTQFSTNTIANFEKKPITVLVKSADDPRNPFSSAGYWQKERIRILKYPIKTTRYENGYTTEVYSLSAEEIATPIDPNIITDLHFR